MSHKNINYIITNSTPTGDYTPSTTETLEEAREWLLECTINNYISFRGPLLIGRVTRTSRKIKNSLKKQKISSMMI